MTVRLLTMTEIRLLAKIIGNDLLKDKAHFDGIGYWFDSRLYNGTVQVGIHANTITVRLDTTHHNRLILNTSLSDPDCIDSVRNVINELIFGGNWKEKKAKELNG